MKKVAMLVIGLMMTGAVTLAYAADADKGKVLFADPELGGGTTGRSCLSCHAGGDGLGSDLFQRQEFVIMGMTKKTLPEVINVCIENPMRGTAIDPQGEEMVDLMAYMQTLVSHSDQK
jgi:cytochrome c553